MLQSDRGKEFLGKATQQVLKTNHIVYRPLFGLHQAAVFEHYIYRIEMKLYILLRGTLSNKWAAQIQNEVTSFNKTPIERLGRLVPNSELQFSSESSVKVDEAH